MPVFFAQRYSPSNETVAVTAANSANAGDEKMWPSPAAFTPSAVTHPQNEYSRRVTDNESSPPPPPSSSPTPPPPPPDDEQHQHYGQQQYAAAGYAGCDYSAAHGRPDVAIAATERNSARQPNGYGGVVPGSEGYGYGTAWQQAAAGTKYGQVYPAAPASQGYWQQQQQPQQGSYGQAQGQEPQYAQPMCWDGHALVPRTYSQQMLGQPVLTQPAQAVAPSAAAWNPGAASFTPINAPQPTAPSFQQVRQQPPVRSVSHGIMDSATRVDKQTRYVQEAPRMRDPALALLHQRPPLTDADYYTAMGMPGLAKRAREIKAKEVRQAGQQAPSHALTAPAVQPPAQRRIPQSQNAAAAEGPHPAWMTPLDRTFRRETTPGQSSEASDPTAKSPKNPHLKVLPRPFPVESYMRQALEDLDFRTAGPRPLLIVLDLNGTLLFRKNRGANFVARPRVSEFLHYLLTNHKVLIWSSAKPENVQAMCQKLFTDEQREKLVGIWGRDKLRLSPAQYNMKVQVYKQLSWAWRDHIIASSCVGGDEWDQSNTVLIDDSEEKAASEPYNLLLIDEFEATPEQMQVDVLGQVVEFLEVLKQTKDVSSCMRVQPYGFRRDVPAFDWMPIVNDMH